MGFRFRRSVKLLPGVRLNFSKTGVSTSLGGRGATVNIGRRGTRATFGLPGTGLSYSTRLFGRSGRGDPSPRRESVAPSAGSALLGWIVIGILVLMLGMCAAGRNTTPAPPEPAVQALTAPALPTRIVAGDGVNCRAAPDKRGAILGRLGKGARVAVVDRAQGWTKIARPGGDCWVSDTLLSAPG